jgi:hypothetical protein
LILVPFLFSFLTCDCDYLIPNARHLKCCKVEKCRCRKVSKGRRHWSSLHVGGEGGVRGDSRCGGLDFVIPVLC